MNLKAKFPPTVCMHQLNYNMKGWHTSLYFINVWMRACHQKKVRIHSYIYRTHRIASVTFLWLFYQRSSFGWFSVFEFGLVSLEYSHSNATCIQYISAAGASSAVANTDRMSYYDYRNYLAVRVTDQMDRVVNLPLVSTFDEDDENVWKKMRASLLLVSCYFVVN